WLKQWRLHQHYPSPDHAHAMIAEPLLPTSFCTLDAPLSGLLHPRWRWLKDGEDTGLVTSRPQSGSWNEDSTIFCCAAVRADAEEPDSEPVTGDVSGIEPEACRF